MKTLIERYDDVIYVCITNNNYIECTPEEAKNKNYLIWFVYRQFRKPPYSGRNRPAHIPSRDLVFQIQVINFINDHQSVFDMITPLLNYFKKNKIVLENNLDIMVEIDIYCGYKGLDIMGVSNEG